MQGDAAEEVYEDVLRLLLVQFKLDPEQVDANGMTAFQVANSKVVFTPTTEAKKLLEACLSARRYQQSPFESADAPLSAEEAILLEEAILESLTTSRRHVAPLPTELMPALLHNADVLGASLLDEEERRLQRALAMSMEASSNERHPNADSEL